MMCPLLEDFAVDAESVVAGQGNEIGILPRAIALFHPLADGLCLLFQPFCLQGCHPGMYHQARQFWYDLVAGWVTVGLL